MASLRMESPKRVSEIASEEDTIARTVMEMMEDPGAFIPGRDALVEYLQNQKSIQDPQRPLDLTGAVKNFTFDTAIDTLQMSLPEALLEIIPDLATGGAAGVAGLFASPKALAKLRGTKILTKSGRPQLVFHTSKGNRPLRKVLEGGERAVDKSDVLVNQGVFFHPMNKATEAFAGTLNTWNVQRGASVEPAYLNIQNPYNLRADLPVDNDQLLDLLAAFITNPRSAGSSGPNLLDINRGHPTNRTKISLARREITSDIRNMLEVAKKAKYDTLTNNDLSRLIGTNPVAFRDAGFDGIIFTDTILRDLISNLNATGGRNLSEHQLRQVINRVNPESARELIAFRGDQIINPITGEGLPHGKAPFPELIFSSDPDAREFQSIIEGGFAELYKGNYVPDRVVRNLTDIIDRNLRAMVPEGKYIDTTTVKSQFDAPSSSIFTGPGAKQGDSLEQIPFEKQLEASSKKMDEILDKGLYGQYDEYPAEAMVEDGYPYFGLEDDIVDDYINYDYMDSDHFFGNYKPLLKDQQHQFVEYDDVLGPEYKIVPQQTNLDPDELDEVTSLDTLGIKMTPQAHKKLTNDYADLITYMEIEDYNDFINSESINFDELHPKAKAAYNAIDNLKFALGLDEMSYKSFFKAFTNSYNLTK